MPSNTLTAIQLEHGTAIIATAPNGYVRLDLPGTNPRHLLEMTDAAMLGRALIKHATQSEDAYRAGLEARTASPATNTQTTP